MNKYDHRLSRFGLGLYVATTFSAVSASAQTQRVEPQAPVAVPAKSGLQNAVEMPTLERVLALARERAPEVMVARAEVEAVLSVTTSCITSRDSSFRWTLP